MVRLPNTPAAIATLIAGWRDKPARVPFEATGAYDLALRQALEAAGIAFARVDPARARDFVRAAGFLAKTDALAATMLAAMAQCLDPPPAAPERHAWRSCTNGAIGSSPPAGRNAPAGTMRRPRSPPTSPATSPGWRARSPPSKPASPN